MEEIFNYIKDFILSVVNPLLSEYEDETTPMNAIEDKNIIFGAVDLSRFDKSKNVCVVVPENEEEDDSEIGAYKISSGFTVSFLCRGEKQDVLVRQMCRYGAAFRRAVLDDLSLNGTVERAEIGRREFFTDAGTVSNQMTAVEISLSVETEDEIDI